MAAQHTPASHPWKPPLLLILAATAFLFLAAPAAAQRDNNSSSNSNNDNITNPIGSFNPSMAIVIVVLISVFFFLGFFSIYVRQCAGDGDGGASFTARTLQAARSRRQRGLDPAVLETFPTLVYSKVKGLKIGKGSLECAVCLSEFEDDENLRLLPKCSHVFHPDCIDAWLSSHVTCPVCRANLDEPIVDSKSPAELLHASGTDAELQPVQPLPPPPPPEQVVIAVDQEKESCEAEAEDEAAVLDRIGSQRRQARAAATGRPPAPAPPRRFPRSHSTGHSLLQPVENLDRYTLRLPEHIRREIFAASKLQRTKSFPANSAGGEGSVQRGWRVAGGGEGSSRGWRSFRLGRSDRWQSFLVRTLSVSAWGSRRGGNGDGETSVKKGDGEGSFKKSGSTHGVDGDEGSVRGKLFDCLGGGGASMKAEGAAADESLTAPLARV